MNKFSCYTSRAGNVLSQQLQLVWRTAMVVVAAFLFSGNAFGQIPSSYCDGNPAGWPLSGAGTARVIDKVNSNSDDQFTEGSKDGNLISQNAWSPGTANDKGDIINAGAALVDGCVLRFFADRYAVNGDAGIGFWFYKDPNVSLNPDGTFSGVHLNGDILILVEFVNGGGTAEPEAFEWLDGELVELTSVDGCGITNEDEIDVPSGLSNYQSKFGPAGKYEPGAFFEGYVDLCGSGIDLCFSRFLVETRNSQELTAALQDFALGDIDITPAMPLGTATDETCLVEGTITVTDPIVGFSYILRQGTTIVETIVATAGNPVIFDELEAGSYSLSAEFNECESGGRPIDVDADLTPASAPGVNDVDRCGPGTVTLAVGVPLTGITYRWYDATGNTLLHTGISFTTPSLTQTTTYLVTATSANGCESATTSVQAIIQTPVVVEAGGPDARCQSSSAQVIPLTGASITGGATTGTWSIVSSVPADAGNVLGNNTLASGNLTVAANYVGTITLQLLSADPAGACPAVSDTRVVTIGPAAVVEAGGPDTRCQSSTAQAVALTGASVTGGAATGTWSIVSSMPADAGNMLSDNTLASGSLTVAANYVGVITLQLTSADPDGAGPCMAVSDTRTVTINEAAIVEAGGPDTRCQSTSAQVIALTGASVTGGATTGTWSIVSSVPANAGNMLGDNTLTSGSLTVAANYVGVITLQLTSSDPDGAGPCQAVSDTRTVTIGPAAIVDAGANLERCQLSTTQAIALTGATVSGGTNTGTWSIVSSVPANAGNMLGDNTLTSGSLTVAANYVGVITLQLTSADPDGAGPCLAVSDTRTVTIYPAATVEAGGPYTVTCIEPRSVQLNGSFGGGASSGTWSGGGGTFSPNASTANAIYTPSAAELMAGTPITLTFTTNNPTGPCEAVSDMATVNFDVCRQDIFCTRTQGFYGNKGGKVCDGRTTTQLLIDLLSTPLVIGRGSNTFTIGTGSAGANCVLAILPGGKEKVALDQAYSCSNLPAVNKQGRLENNFLAQTITLGLNLRMDPGLSSAPLSASFVTLNTTGCGETAVAIPGTGMTFYISSKVLDELEENYSLTVGGLYDLANDALGGVYVPMNSGDPSLTDIHNAVDTINNAFDGCRALQSTLTASTSSSLQGIEKAEAGELRAYPTPFSDKATIEFTTAVDENYTVRLYDMRGALIRELKSGTAKAGVMNQVEVDGRNLPEGLYLGRVVSDSGSQTVKLLLKR